MDAETKAPFEYVLGMATANMTAIKALDVILTEAGIVPEGTLARVIQDVPPTETDLDGAFDRGMGFVSTLLESKGEPPALPGWLRGGVDGGKTPKPEDTP